MTEVILQILLSTMNIFSDERRRHFSKKLLDLNDTLDNERAKVFPEYNDARVARARLKLDNFVQAYSKELKLNLNELIAKAGKND